MDAIERGGCIRALAHEHDALHYIVVIYHYSVCTVNRLSNLAQADFWPLGDDSNVLDAQRSAVLRLEDSFLDVANVVNQPHSANVDLLCPLFDKTASGIRVAVRQLLLDLRKTESVGDQLVGIDTN